MKPLFLISASVLLASSAFAQSRCVNAPVSVKGNQVTVTSSGASSVTNKQAFVYYERKRHHKHEKANSVAGITHKWPSKPVMLNTERDVKAVPESYNVSLATPQGTAAVCPDTTNEVAANLSVEKMATYTGNYPDYRDDRMYKQVSKRDYKMAARKKRKIEKKEMKIARRSGTSVTVKSDRAIAQK